MKLSFRLLAFLMVMFLTLVGTRAFAQQPAAEAAEAAEAPAREAETTKTDRTTPAARTPDYRDALNRSLSPTATPATPPGYVRPARTLFPQKTGYPMATTPLTTPSDENITSILDRYSPDSLDYTQGRKSYDLMQQQMQRRQLGSTLGIRPSTFATSNPDLYRKQVTQEVSNVLKNRYGISAAQEANLDTLLNVSRNASPARTMNPDGKRYIPSTSATQPATSSTGARPRLDRVARINAGLGTSPDLRRYQGLTNYDANRLSAYSDYRSREYGTVGNRTPYSVPRAYQHSQMRHDIRYLKESYGIKVDPTRTTYSDLYRLRSGVTPR